MTPKTRFKIHTPEGYRTYSHRVNKSNVDMNQWFEIVRWCNTNFGDNRSRWTKGWLEIYFNNEQDLLLFQLMWS